MSEAATAVQEGKEADHHPYFRPKDAATLILIDRSGDKPKVLVGKRHDKVVFMPGKYVFPGGRVDKSDNRIPVAAPISAELEANLLKGSPKIAPSRARALAVAAIREACEETGLCLGCKVEKPVKELVWVEIGSQPLADAHAMTKNVLAELDRRLATGPLKHDAPVPFFHFYGGKMQKDVLGA